MKDILAIAQQNQQRAWELIKETDIIAIWQSIGAEINLVGSLKSGLLMKNRDVDFHIYSDPVVVSDSFLAVARLSENPAVKHIEYTNLLDTEEACLEWHIRYEDKQGDMWKFDLIHIRKGSAFDGYMEQVTQRVIDVLTPKTRLAILQLKYDIPETDRVMGIEVYHAVLEGKVHSYSEFREWRKNNPITGVLKWMP